MARRARILMSRVEARSRPTPHHFSATLPLLFPLKSWRKYLQKRHLPSLLPKKSLLPRSADASRRPRKKPKLPHRPLRSKLPKNRSKLPNRSNYTSEGSLCVYYSYYDGLFEQNVCTTQHIHDAKLKFWTTYQTSDNTSFYLYEGYTVPTNIRTAEADGEDDVPRYNMSGQRVGKDYKGIVIVNGRKVVK